MDEQAAVSALAALAQAMRLRVFRALVGAAPAGLTPSALAALLGVPASTLSFHLKALEHAGLVTQEREAERDRSSATARIDLPVRVRFRNQNSHATTTTAVSKINTPVPRRTHWPRKGFDFSSFFIIF